MQSTLYPALMTNIVSKSNPGGVFEVFLPEYNFQGIADWYNQASTFITWRRAVTWAEIIASSGFAWTEVDNIAASKSRIWEWMFLKDNSINFERANIRAGIAAVWTGTMAKDAVQAAIIALGKRPATEFEMLFVTGTGTTATPGLLGVFEGKVTPIDVGEALSPYYTGHTTGHT